MAMATRTGENTVHLLKDHNLRLGNRQTTTFILNGRAAALSNWEPPISVSCSTSSYSTALTAYINEEMQDGRGNPKYLQIDIYYPMPIVQVDLGKNFVTNLCRILPKPFIQIKGTIEDYGKYQDGKVTQSTVNKRLDLLDILALVRKYGDHELKQCFSTRSSCSSGSWIFSVLIGWMATPSDHTIQVSTETIIKGLFENEPTKDLTIVAANGAEVKCHKIIFSAQSAVLTTMIMSSGLKEAKGGRVELSENSEDGIRLLLRYLYGLELVTKGITCELMVELFQTAHKYELDHLQCSLYSLLLEKDAKWFTPDVLLELYFYSKNVGDFKRLADHVLSLMTRINTQALRSCEEFKKLDRATQWTFFVSRSMHFKRKTGQQSGNRMVRDAWTTPILI